MTGTITITPTRENGELRLNVTGRWSDCRDDLWIRYELCLAQDDSPDAFLVGSSQRLSTFQRSGTGVSNYSGLHNFDLTKPYRAVFDYEIWSGEPLKGELLTKNSLVSSEILSPP